MPADCGHDGVSICEDCVTQIVEQERADVPQPARGCIVGLGFAGLIWGAVAFLLWWFR